MILCIVHYQTSAVLSHFCTSSSVLHLSMQGCISVMSKASKPFLRRCLMYMKLTLAPMQNFSQINKQSFHKFMIYSNVSGWQRFHSSCCEALPWEAFAQQGEASCRGTTQHPTTTVNYYPCSYILVAPLKNVTDFTVNDKCEKREAHYTAFWC